MKSVVSKYIEQGINSGRDHHAAFSHLPRCLEQQYQADPACDRPAQAAAQFARAAQQAACVARGHRPVHGADDPALQQQHPLASAGVRGQAGRADRALRAGEQARHAAHRDWRVSGTAQAQPRVQQDRHPARAAASAAQPQPPLPSRQRARGTALLFAS
ncbi:hypothetical protein DFA_12119 [Cavenderia fasciculata]|uniref:Uncharacterized protein n=1 Tax=Cavenderia fasciculata TaxID=261658 RepID=F4QFV2_CACFS|nr:uncharacterized protein DFA_12119 [Cavenderia fasciculata]EGG14349.1 hypothetical protein DFA_12119 [Cavenderia fasciculata]|eukprot:XP_004351062.1 hypothetical protein DFA_12119 [Cavenderia fasciculata]